jgi:hypothetical protein
MSEAAAAMSDRRIRIMICTHCPVPAGVAFAQVIGNALIKPKTDPHGVRAFHQRWLG